MRIINRPLAFLAACALLAASVILVIEVIAAAVGRGPAVVPWDSWYAWAEGTRFKEGVIRFWAIVLIVLGSALLYLQLKPRRATRVPTESDHEATDAAITRRGLRGALEAAATGVDGVRTATADVSRGKAAITCLAAGRDRQAARALSAPVLAAAQAALDGMQPRRPLRLSVRVTPGSS